MFTETAESIGIYEHIASKYLHSASTFIVHFQVSRPFYYEKKTPSSRQRQRSRKEKSTYRRGDFSHNIYHFSCRDHHIKQWNRENLLLLMENKAFAKLIKRRTSTWRKVGHKSVNLQVVTWVCQLLCIEKFILLFFHL